MIKKNVSRRGGEEEEIQNFGVAKATKIWLFHIDLIVRVGNTGFSKGWFTSNEKRTSGLYTQKCWFVPKLPDFSSWFD